MNDALGDMLTEAQKYETCMALNVNEDGSSVELVLDTGVATYGEWIPGEEPSDGLPVRDIDFLLFDGRDFAAGSGERFVAEIETLGERD